MGITLGLTRQLYLNLNSDSSHRVKLSQNLLPSSLLCLATSVKNRSAPCSASDTRSLGGVHATEWGMAVPSCARPLGVSDMLASSIVGSDSVVARVERV